jgi:hypothetical protein
VTQVDLAYYNSIVGVRGRMEFGATQTQGLIWPIQIGENGVRVDITDNDWPFMGLGDTKSSLGSWDLVRGLGLKTRFYISKGIES